MLGPGGSGPGIMGSLQGGFQLQGDVLSASQSCPSLEVPGRGQGASCTWDVGLARAGLLVSL